MERAVEERFERIEALLHAMAEREHQMEIRFNQRMEKADRRMDRADHRLDRAEQRVEKFDRRLHATRKLVEAGAKIVVDIGGRQKANEASIHELRKSQSELAKSLKAFLDSLRRSGTGHRPAA